MQMNPHGVADQRNRREGHAGCNKVLSAQDQPLHTTLWNTGNWEDQNAATSTDAPVPQTRRMTRKRALEDDVTNLKFSARKQGPPGLHLPQHYSRPATTSPKHQKTEPSANPVGLACHDTPGDLLDVKHERSEYQILYNRKADARGVEVEKGDDIADARIQLAWAHNKVKMLAAQLQAARDQCTQLQTASNSVPPPEGLSGILAEEWQSEDCSTVVASKLEVVAAGSHSQTENTPKPPVSQSAPECAAPQIPNHDDIAPKPEPLVHTDGPQNCMHDDFCAPPQTCRDTSEKIQCSGCSKLDREGSLDDVTRAESTVSSGDNAGDGGDGGTGGVQGGVTSALQGTLQQDLDGARDVASLAALLSSSHKGRLCNLNQRIMHAPLSSTPGSTAWRSLALQPTRSTKLPAPLGSVPLEAGSAAIRDTPSDDMHDTPTFKLETCGGESVVCTVSGAHTQLCNGELKLSENTVLVFDSSCAGVVISNMHIHGALQCDPVLLIPEAYVITCSSTFVKLLYTESDRSHSDCAGLADGVVVCYGRGCNISFEDVTFSRCTVVALAGAQVSVTTSTFNQTPRGIALLSSERGTTARMHGIKITHGSHGVLVQQGAKLTASSISVTQVSCIGVEVRDENSHAQLTDCDMHDFSRSSEDCSRSKDAVVGPNSASHAAQPPSLTPTEYHRSGTEIRPATLSAYTGTGIIVHGGSAACLESITVSGMCHGISIQSGAHGKITDCTVSETFQSCITFESAANGTVHNCTLKNSQKVCGLCVRGETTSVEASECCFIGHAYTGVVVLKGGSLTADACASSVNKYEGFYVHDAGSHLKLVNCSSDHDLRGCGVQGKGATLILEETAIEDACADGVAAWSSGSAVLRHCAVRRCRRDGVTVKDSGSRVELEHCTVSGPQYDCAVAKAGGFLRVQECTLKESVSGCGVRASGQSTDVEIEGCTIMNHATHAVLAIDEATIDVCSSRSMRNAKRAYVACTRAQLSVTDSSSEGDSGVGGVEDEGVLCMEGIKVHMEGRPRGKPAGCGPKDSADASQEKKHQNN